MKNIFKENDVLLKEFGAVQLAGDDLVLFEHNKKSYFACFLYWYAGFGLHRFYMGDKFSKIYGCYFLITDILTTLFLSRVRDNLLVYTILFIYFILYMIDLYLLVPLLRRQNLLLKQNIIKINTTIKDRGPYRLQEAFSILALILSSIIRDIVARILSQNLQVNF